MTNSSLFGTVRCSSSHTTSPHVQQVFNLPLNCVHAWMDGTIVLSWLVSNPRHFKTYVGNRVSRIVELIAPDQWNNVNGTENSADCTSRGLFLSYWKMSCGRMVQGG